MATKNAGDFSIRELNSESEEEISLVVERMRLTMIERMGHERGTAIYSMEWLRNRLLWHLDSDQTLAKVLLLENKKCQIVAHAIARIEKDQDEECFGYFSTIYVIPELRNKGLAAQLMLEVETWFRSINIPKIIYNTAANHEKLIYLFGKHGYQITHSEGEMVQLTKVLI